MLDSFGLRTLRNMAEMARLRGAVTTIVGIQPDVAFAMVELGLDTGSVRTALDLEEALEYLAVAVDARGARRDSLRRMSIADALRRDYRVAFLSYLPRREEKASARRIRARPHRCDRGLERARAGEDPS